MKSIILSYNYFPFQYFVDCLIEMNKSFQSQSYIRSRKRDLKFYLKIFRLNIMDQ